MGAFLRSAFVGMILCLAACGARTPLREPPDGSIPEGDVPRADVPRADVPRADAGETVIVACPAAIFGRQTDTVPVAATATSNLRLPLTYQWTVTQRPTGSTAEPAPATSAATNFTFDAGGDWTLRFTATDSRGTSGTCTTHLHATPAISLRCPNDQSNYQGATVPLVATASSTLGRSLTLRWTVESRPTASTSAPTPLDAATSQILLDQLGDWRLQLTATDSAGLTARCETSVHADPDVIVACPADAMSAPFATLQIRASAASRLGLPLTYRWETVDHPITSTAALASTNGLATAFTFDVAGDWTWRFTATNPRGNSASCTTRALATSSEAVRVEVVWNTDRACSGCNAEGGGQDLDLHVTDVARAGGHWASTAPDSSDCYYANCRCGSPGMLCPTENIDWTPAGPVNNPQLDVDHISDLPGPENINIVQASTGSQFDVGVHFYSSHGIGATSATVVRVYCRGTVAFESEVVRFAEGGGGPDGNNLWRVGRVTVTAAGCSFERCGSPGNLGACIRPESAW